MTGRGEREQGMFFSQCFPSPLLLTDACCCPAAQRKKNLYIHFFFGGGWEGGMITRSSWHICCWILMGATAVQRGKGGWGGAGGVQLQLSRDGVILSNIFETKKYVFSVLKRTRQGSNTGLGCPGSQAPPKKTELSEVGLRRSWWPARSIDTAKPKGACPGWQTGNTVLTAPLVFPFQRSVHSARAATSKCSMMRGWRMGARILGTSFRLEFTLICFAGVWSTQALGITLPERGAVTPCGVTRVPSGPSSLCGRVWSHNTSPLSSSHHRTLVPLLHL